MFGILLFILITIAIYFDFVMFLFSHCLYYTVINVKFDFDISLFMLSMCNTIIRYFCSSHVSIEFLCIHTCMSL